MSDVIRIDNSMVKLIEEYREKVIKFKTSLYEGLKDSDDETIKHNAAICLRSCNEFKDMDYKDVLRDSLIQAIVALDRLM